MSCSKTIVLSFFIHCRIRSLATCACATRSVLTIMPSSSSRQLRSAATLEASKETKKRPASAASPLSTKDRILQGLHDRSDAKTKAWFTNYVKGTVWIGCKVPTVRATIIGVMGEKRSPKRLKTADANTQKASTATIMDTAIQLLQHEACDARLAGMLLLSEHYPPELLATMATLDRFDQDIWQDRTALGDWSSSDWFSNKVLSKIVFYKDDNDNTDRHYLLQHRVLDYTRQPQASLWQRRCGIVSFLHYHKHPKVLPHDFGAQLIQASQDNLLASPNERFTQTGIAWVLRYVLLLDDKQDADLALDFICRHGLLWTMEAKKSFCEKLSQSDARRTKIMRSNTVRSL
jgi:DNA alkylation repair enzyme